MEKPEASEREVFVKVEATTVNRTDCGYRATKPISFRFFTGTGNAASGLVGPDSSVAMSSDVFG